MHRYGNVRSCYHTHLTEKERAVASQGQRMAVFESDLMLRFIITALLFQKEMPNILINLRKGYEVPIYHT